MRSEWKMTVLVGLAALAGWWVAPRVHAPEPELDAQWEPCVRFPGDVECCWRPEKDAP